MSGIYRGVNGSAVADALNIDGDKGDLTISNSGSDWTINPDTVTFAKMQNISTDTVLGRATAGSGDVEEIPCTAAGRALLDDVDAAAQRTTLGLGTAATTNSTDYATAAQGTKADTAHGWGNHAVAGYAIDSTVVHLSGTETITGAKTFSSTITGSITGNAGTVTNGVYTSGSYADPSWITSLAETKVLPSQTGNANKVLITNGTSTSFSLIDEDNLAALIDLGSI